MKLASSVQRVILDWTPVFWLDLLCRKRPKFAIDLLCYWVNELTPIHESGLERELVERQLMLLPVVKKLSKVSTLGILNLLKQDPSLWKLYVAGSGLINMKTLPFILLEIMFELGGPEGRKKVVDVAIKSRTSVSGPKQGEMFETFKVSTVLHLFEQLPEGEVKMRLQFSTPEAVAFWLDYWDREMLRLRQPLKSTYWLGQLPGERAFKIESLMRTLEFRKRYDRQPDIYDDIEDVKRSSKSGDW